MPSWLSTDHISVYQAAQVYSLKWEKKPDYFDVEGEMDLPYDLPIKKKNLMQ